MPSPASDALTRAFRALIPPERVPLSTFIERELRLPAGVSALPGPVRLWRPQIEIANAISDPAVERVTVVKSVRSGFTTLLTGTIALYAATEPCPILVLLPTESDARDFTVSDVEPIFHASPALQGALTFDHEEGDRNTLLSRRFPGGSLKIVASRAPRNLRRHTVRVLLIDEADAMTAGPEGNPIRLAERRTLSFGDRKIVLGSSPTNVETSIVLRSYANSDARVFECPCPECGTFHEIQWGDIEWPPDHPADAAYRCPHCKTLIPEQKKGAMVGAGVWRVTRDAPGHAGFRLNALASTLPNASWGKLATEFVVAKNDPDELRTFVNTILAQGWAGEAPELDEDSLASRAEPFGLEAIPRECLVITAGIDVADDRLEVSLVGWTREHVALVLGHIVIWGSPDDDTLWIELDELLRTKWRHPLGGMIGVDGAAVNSGDGDWTDKVYNFCFPRASRRVMAIKGMYGNRPSIQASKAKVKGGRLWLVGVDVVKTTIFNRLQRGQLIRFSHDLEPVYYEQLASERRVIRYKRGLPTRRFERVSGRAKAEALDCLCYAFACRSAVTIHFDAREQTLRNVPVDRRAVIKQLASKLAH